MLIVSQSSTTSKMTIAARNSEQRMKKRTFWTKVTISGIHFITATPCCCLLHELFDSLAKQISDIQNVRSGKKISGIQNVRSGKKISGIQNVRSCPPQISDIQIVRSGENISMSKMSDLAKRSLTSKMSDLAKKISDVQNVRSCPPKSLTSKMSDLRCPKCQIWQKDL